MTNSVRGSLSTFVPDLSHAVPLSGKRNAINQRIVSVHGGVQDDSGLANDLQIGASMFIWQMGQQARKLRQRSCLINAIFRGFT